MSRQSQPKADQGGQTAGEVMQFEMENKLQSTSERKQVIDRANQQIRSLQALLRQGGSQEDFEALNTLIQGFEALKRVVDRIGRQAKT